MLDLARLNRITLSRHPVAQRLTGQLLTLNYRLISGVEIEFEHVERLPAEPVIFAMNHTDRYNYFPFQYHLWQHHNRFTTTWVKGKYYENAFVGAFMEKTNQLPTISRGYLITKDFTEALGRKPSDDEYERLRRWVDAAANGDDAEARPDSGQLPDQLVNQPRDVLGYAFDPTKEDYPSYLNALFRIMMRRFIELNEEAVQRELDMLIFPQGTRSIRLLPGRIGVSQIALHLKKTLVPVGCNGSDVAYPGSSPWAKKSHIVYRLGEPLHYDDITEFHIDEEFEPFSPEAESRYADRFQGLAALLTKRIDGLLDERYRLGAADRSDTTQGAGRFI
jgi:1-acyl-sn-glycerol-3-phosphate acyltransferase